MRYTMSGSPGRSGASDSRCGGSAGTPASGGGVEAAKGALEFEVPVDDDFVEGFAVDGEGEHGLVDLAALGGAEGVFGQEPGEDLGLVGVGQQVGQELILQRGPIVAGLRGGGVRLLGPARWRWCQPDTRSPVTAWNRSPTVETGV
jgi:hypothetical protein